MATTVTIFKEIANPRMRVQITPEKDPRELNPRHRVDMMAEGVTTHLGDKMKTRVTVIDPSMTPPGADPLNTRVTIDPAGSGDAPDVSMQLPAGVPPPPEHVIAQLHAARDQLTAQKKQIEMQLRDVMKALRLAEAVGKRVGRQVIDAKGEEAKEKGPEPEDKGADPGLDALAAALDDAGETADDTEAQADGDSETPEIVIPPSYESVSREALVELAVKLDIQVGEEDTKSQIYDALVAVADEE